MNFEYGVQTNNRYNFFIDQEDVDPSDLIAKVSVSTEKSTSKDTKPVSGKGGKPATGTSAAGKTKPLQQSDNAVKSKGDDSAKGKDARTNKTQQAPRQDKENQNRDGTARRPASGFQQRSEQGENRGDGERPPRRNPAGPRPARFRQEGELNENAPNPNLNREGGVDAAAQPGGFRRGGGRGGARGGFRGGQGGFTRRREENGRPERDFDRHSGSDKTGVKAVEKRNGAGMNNWGTPEDELTAAVEPVKEVEEEQVAGEQSADWAAQAEEGEAKEDEEAVPKYMTLDEYKALRNEVNKKNQFNIRRPGEGEDSSRWSEFVVKQREEGEEEGEEEEEEEEEEEQQEEEEDERQKLVNSIKIQFYSEPSSRGTGRGGRGGDRRFGGERRSYGERREGDDQQPRGERRPYGERREGDDQQPRGERRPYGERREGDDQQPRGERRQFGGERRPYGERRQQEGQQQPEGVEGEEQQQQQPRGERRQFGGERRQQEPRAEGEGEQQPRRQFRDRRPQGEPREPRPEGEGEQQQPRERRQFGGEQRGGARPNNRGGPRTPGGERPEKKVVVPRIEDEKDFPALG